MGGIRWLKQLLVQSRGFSLVEISVAVAILSLGISLVGGAMFQVLAIQRFWEDDRIATKETRHAASWFAGDALETTATNLVDSAPGADTVTLTLDSGDITYSISGGSLIRQTSGSSNIVAKDAVSVAFSLAGNVLTFVLEVDGSRGATETLTLQNYLRLLD